MSEALCNLQTSGLQHGSVWPVAGRLLLARAVPALPEGDDFSSLFHPWIFPHAGSKEEFHMQSVLIEDRSSQYQSYGEFLAFLHKCVLAKS